MSDKKPLAPKKGGLGRGLDALLTSNNTVNDDVIYQDPLDKPQGEASSNQAVTSGSILEINVDFIATNPWQPREDFGEEALQELAESIKIHGIIQPLTVRKLSDKEFQLISGERRLQASRLAGLSYVPAYIRTANDQQMLEMALIENIQRENLNAIEIALSYQRLMAECQLKQEELGDRVGKKRSTVTNYLRLLRLPPEIQVAVRDGGLSMGHARALVNISFVEDQLSVYKQVISQDLSVRRTEEIVRELNEPKKPRSSRKAGAISDVEIQKIQQKLATRYGTQIRIKNGADYKGEIRIPYFNLGDLNRLLEMLDA